MPPITIRLHATAAGSLLMAPVHDRAPAPHTGRELLVVGAGSEVAVALRERVDRAYVTVREVDATAAAAGVAACAPWPWMVIGTVSDVDPGLFGALRHRPILVLWLGPPPAGLPRHCRSFARFSDLAAAVDAALSAQVGGIRLSIGAGLVLPGGKVRDNPELEALVCSHPHPFALPLQRFRSARDSLRRAGIGWRPAPTAAGVVLRRAGVQG